MVLLQNRKYKTDGITSLLINESKMLIESLVEACTEGEISCFEASDIITQEIDCSNIYHQELLEMLYEAYDEDKVFEIYKFMDDISEKASLEIQKSMKLGTFNRETYNPEIYKPKPNQSEMEAVATALINLENYWLFLRNTFGKLSKIGESVDYERNRKEKIKLKIIKDGLESLVKKEGHTHEQNSNGITNIHLNPLLSLFPKFSSDHELLIKHGFLEITEDKLSWRRSKQSLTEYFQSIRPEGMEKIRWSIIEKCFGEKNLKNSASSNGNPFHKSSKDIEKWQKIKSTLEGKENTPKIPPSVK